MEIETAGASGSWKEMETEMESGSWMEMEMEGDLRAPDVLPNFVG